ncbi:MAG: tRNA 2-thiocytidine biosynthesis protein TtcA [Ruminococcaceae bacterium]|nr:tRNA 2-thiocytidine biosynthesis protein TtcA [Oscillospiraceae bacterium]
MERVKEIERSIIKKFRKSVWNPFCGALNDYELIKEGDKIAVCISGGKDSMILAKCMQELHRHSNIPFEVVYICMDPGYREDNKNLLEKNIEILDIPVEIFNSDIFDIVNTAGGSPCYLCARMRRGALYAKAQSLGCNKIALGHHFDDVIETLLMSMMYSSEIKTMLPKLKSSNFEGLELIRPLYKVKEKDIIAWAKSNSLEFLQCACRFTEDSQIYEGLSKRREIKNLIANIKKTNPNVDDNIFRSLHNVNLSQIVGFREADKGELHSFLENYDK